MRRSIDSASVLSNDDMSEYDIISDGQQSLESSIADLGLADKAPAAIYEPAPTSAAENLFGTPTLTSGNIQAYVRANVNVDPTAARQSEVGSRRPVRVYVDGLFDPFDVGHALQFRQAKLSFPSVQLLVGVFSDDICAQHAVSTRIPHLERCELLRHCRWVDEVVPDAPWKLDDAFLNAMRIDYVAIDEGVSINPAYDKERVKGYDLVKSLRKAIPTRRTIGLSRPLPSLSPVPPPSPVPPAPSPPRVEVKESSTSANNSGTIRRVTPPRVEWNECRNGQRSPFEEPLVDLFD